VSEKGGRNPAQAHIKVVQWWGEAKIGIDDHQNWQVRFSLTSDQLNDVMTYSGKTIDLRPKKFLLLEHLVRNVSRPVTRTMILELYGTRPSRV